MIKRHQHGLCNPLSLTKSQDSLTKVSGDLILDETRINRRNAVKSMIFQFVRKTQSQDSLTQSHFVDEILRLT